VPVRHGRPDLAGDRDRPAADRLGRGRPDREADPRPLLRRGARPAPGISPLADGDPAQLTSSVPARPPSSLGAWDVHMGRGTPAEEARTPCFCTSGAPDAPTWQVRA